jgi:hypothetical protein
MKFCVISSTDQILPSSVTSDVFNSSIWPWWRESFGAVTSFEIGTYTWARLINVAANYNLAVGSTVNGSSLNLTNPNRYNAGGTPQGAVYRTSSTLPGTWRLQSGLQNTNTNYSQSVLGFFVRVA